MRESRLFGQTYLHVGIDFLLPILMIRFAWFAIWLATDRQVTQWINYLRRIAVAYRSGHYAIRPDLADAPAEFKLLGDAMSEMAEGIQDRDRRLRESVNMKTTLIKEIHHRVKNNLQIVMSLLSIQANQVKDPGAREALMQAQTRINALALVHRILNELEDQSTLDSEQLLEELSPPDRRRHGRHRACAGSRWMCRSMVVSSSVAVALALFTVEALTNIFKHAFPARGARRDPGRAGARWRSGKLRLAIADDGIGFAMDETGKSVGCRLIRTFGAQLGGVSSVHSEPGEGTVVDLVFPDPDLEGARRSAAHAAKSPGRDGRIAAIRTKKLRFFRSAFPCYGPARKSFASSREFYGGQFRRNRDRRRPRRLQRRHPAGPAGPHRGLRRQARQLRRHLPEYRLHPLQGAAACQRALP